jgi:hypothetical protein
MRGLKISMPEEVFEAVIEEARACGYVNMTPVEAFQEILRSAMTSFIYQDQAAMVEVTEVET